MKKNTLLIILGLFSLQSNAQLFIDDGTDGSIYITNASGGTLTTPETIANNIALYVDSSITIEGTYVNDSAEVQLTGNFTNTGIFTTTGDEVFLGEDTQVVIGSFINDNDFNNLIINKTAKTFIQLNNNVEIDSIGILNLNQGLIKTQPSKYIYTKNSAPTAIINAGTNGTLDKFIEGELRRMLVEGDTYSFPVGRTHIDSAGGDGIQYASIKSNTGDGIIAIIFNDSIGVGVLDSIVICPTGIGDYQDTEYRIRNGSWNIKNPNGGINNYNLTLNPTDYIDNGYIDYTILKDGAPTGRDLCDGLVSNTPLTHDSLTSFSLFEIAATTSTELLPIELIDFNALALNNNAVQLSWQTASEINNDYFTVECSQNTIDWKEVIKMNGAGNSSTLLNYNSYDENPFLGTSYYRLKQTDFDGQFSYSQIRSTTINDSNNPTVSIYPNPTSDQITITATKDKLEQISIYNILGEEIATNHRIIEKNDLKIIIDLSDLTIGTYFIKIGSTANKVYKN